MPDRLLLAEGDGGALDHHKLLLHEQGLHGPKRKGLLSGWLFVSNNLEEGEHVEQVTGGLTGASWRIRSRRFSDGGGYGRMFMLLWRWEGQQTIVE